MDQNTNKQKKIDMTTGPIMRNILLFALPMVIGNVLQQLYTTVDSLVIGQYCGKTALAAVGTSSQPVEVVLCIFLGIGTGVSILVSQYAGANRTDKIQTLIQTATSFVFMVGIPMGILGWMIVPYILKFMSVPADTIQDALIYTRIVFIGALGNIGYNMNAGILRGFGDSKASLYILVVSCITNIVLDIALVAGFGLNVEGVAIATAVALYLSWFTSILYIRKKYPEYRFSFLPKTCSGTELKSILKIGVPIGLNNSLYSFGHMALQTITNLQGSTFMAGNAVAGRITGLSNIAISGMAQAATTFSGQNYGARNFDRLRKGYIKIPLCSGLITISLGLVFIAIRMPILRLFSKDPTVLMYASRYVIVLLLSQWFYAIFNAISNIVNGTGRVKYTTLINLLMLWAVRIPTAYLINRFFDGTYIMLCYPVSFSFGMFCMFGYYAFSKDWKTFIKTGLDEQSL